MDSNLKAYVTKEHEDMPHDKKIEFLRILKFDPHWVLQYFRDNYLRWGLRAAFATGGDVDVSEEEKDCNELLEHFQTHFAEMLAEIKG